jgi:hypothetical protein
MKIITLGNCCKKSQQYPVSESYTGATESALRRDVCLTRNFACFILGCADRAAVAAHDIGIDIVPPLLK